jgi:hypothetical protein
VPSHFSLVRHRSDDHNNKTPMNQPTTNANPPNGSSNSAPTSRARKRASRLTTGPWTTTASGSGAPSERLRRSPPVSRAGRAWSAARRRQPRAQPACLSDVCSDLFKQFGTTLCLQFTGGKFKPRQIVPDDWIRSIHSCRHLCLLVSIPCRRSHETGSVLSEIVACALPARCQPVVPPRRPELRLLPTRLDQAVFRANFAAGARAETGNGEP